MESDRL